MMEGISFEEENIIKDIRNLFRLKQELNSTAIKGIKNLFRLKKETKPTKDRIIRYIRNHFEHEKEDCYKPVRVNNFRSNNYIEHKQ